MLFKKLTAMGGVSEEGFQESDVNFDLRQV